MTQPTDLLSVVQAAAALGISPRALLHRISRGTVAATKVGDGRTSAYVITAAEVERLLVERQRSAAAS